MVQSSKRLAIINSVYDTGSTGTIVKRIEQTAKQKSYETDVLYSRMNTFTSNGVHRFYSTIGFYHHVAMALAFDRHGLYSVSNTKQIIRELERFKPTIVNIHNLHGFYVHYPMLMDYLFSLNIPIVMTLHDCWTFTGFCAHYQASGCDQWQNGCLHCPVKNAYPYRSFISHSAKNLKLKQKWFNHPNITMVTPSNWLNDQLKLSYLHNPVKVIHNTIDTTIFNSEHKSSILSTDRRIVLLVATNWTKNKGREDLTKLYHLLSDQYQLVTVGNLNLKSIPWIHFSRLNRNELASLYQQAYVFVNLTYEDTYPTVNLEANACHTPIISYASGGAGELCRANNRVIPGNIKKVAQMINSDSFDHQPLDIDHPHMEQAYVKLFNNLLSK